MTLEYEPPLEPTVRITVALIGPPKSGKTTAAASAPGPVLYLNAEPKNRLRYARRKYGDKLKVVQVTGEQTLIDATFATFEPEWAGGTVVVDSIAEMYGILLAEASGGNAGKMKHKPTLDQYREVQDMVARFCAKLVKSCPLNVVLVFHDDPEKDEATGEIVRSAHAGPTKPKLARKILGNVDIVAFTGVVETEDGPEYVGQLVQAKGRSGGDGFGCLADPKTGIRRADLAEWIEAIKTHEQEDNDGI